MLKSMTGFGRASFDAAFGRLIVEIQSVNRKHFEVATHLPKELARFEHEVRKWIGGKISRGQISVRMQLILSQEMAASYLPDLEMLKSVKSALELVSKKLKLDPKNIDLPLILASIPQMQKSDLLQEKDVSILQKCVEEALDSLLKMKIREGKALSDDVKKRLKDVQKMVSSIEKMSPELADRMRQKLLEKISAILPNDSSLDERLVREVALYAEKVDIAEELTRLESHFEQFEECLRENGPVGRKMDFVIQEMAREINTIGSKSCESKISYLVVEIKSEIEKIREQIQNIE